MSGMPNLKAMFSDDHPADEPETDEDHAEEEEDMRTLGEAAMKAHADGDGLAYAKAIKRIMHPDEEVGSDEGEPKKIMDT